MDQKGYRGFRQQIKMLLPVYQQVRVNRLEQLFASVPWWTLHKKPDRHLQHTF